MPRGTSRCPARGGHPARFLNCPSRSHSRPSASCSRRPGHLRRAWPPRAERGTSHTEGHGAAQPQALAPSPAQSRPPPVPPSPPATGRVPQAPSPRAAPGPRVPAEMLQCQQRSQHHQSRTLQTGMPPGEGARDPPPASRRCPGLAPAAAGGSCSQPAAATAPRPPARPLRWTGRGVAGPVKSASSSPARGQRVPAGTGRGRRSPRPRSAPARPRPAAHGPRRPPRCQRGARGGSEGPRHGRPRPGVPALTGGGGQGEPEQQQGQEPARRGHTGGLRDGGGAAPGGAAFVGGESPARPRRRPVMWPSGPGGGGGPPSDPPQRPPPPGTSPATAPASPGDPPPAARFRGSGTTPQPGDPGTPPPRLAPRPPHCRQTGPRTPSQPGSGTPTASQPGHGTLDPLLHLAHAPLPARPPCPGTQRGRSLSWHAPHPCPPAPPPLSARQCPERDSPTLLPPQVIQPLPGGARRPGTPHRLQPGAAGAVTGTTHHARTSPFSPPRARWEAGEAQPWL